MVRLEIASFIVSLLGVILHMLFFLLIKREKPVFASGIRRLIYQGKVSLFIWIFLLPIWWYLGESRLVSHIEQLLVKLLGYNLFCFLYSGGWFIIFFFIYLTIYYIVDRSVSSRIMIEIENSPNKMSSFPEIVDRYNIEEKYNNVVEGMIQGRFVYEKKKRLYCTFKGKMIGMTAYILKKILKLGKGG